MKPIRKSTKQPTDGTFDNRPFARIEDRGEELVKIRATDKQTDHRFCTTKKCRDNEEMFALSDEDALPKNINRDPDLTAQCCRGAFHLSDKNIVTILKVHGEGIEFYNATQPADPDTGTPADPEWGWDMSRPKEGYPCIALTADGKCSHHPNKPAQCKAFPKRNPEKPIVGCSYIFDENGVRSGACNGCGSLD